MSLHRSLLAAMVLSSFAFACNNDAGSGAGGGGTTEAAPAEDLGETLAEVSGMIVGSKEFEAAAARKAPAAGDTLSAEEKQEVLDQLVNDKLLYQAALAKGLDRDPKVQKVMVNTLLREVVYANVRNSDFTDEELQAYYESHKEEFVVPEKVQIKRILIKTGDKRSDDEAKAEAERIRAEVAKNPDSFKDLAAKFSEDPYRRRGGDVGFVPKSGKPGLDAEVVNKAFELQVGAVSEVFKSAEGYNVVTVANKRERVERTFQQMKGSVLRKVKNDKLKELYDGYVAGLRQTAQIKVNQDKLALIEIKAARRPGPSLSMNPADMDGEGMPMPMPGGDEDAEHGDEH
jgi:parvulin-like peptidyl-prolyl isomerase